MTTPTGPSSEQVTFAAGDPIVVTRPVAGSRLRGRVGVIVDISDPNPNRTSTASVRLDQVDAWTPAVSLPCFLAELDRR